jgi:galactonate dehydratase
MKITRVLPLMLDRFCIVRIETDTGITGIGETGAWGQLETSAAAIGKYAEYLIGKDPRPIEHHWNVMLRANHFTGTAVNGAVSAIDIALWDIKGKSLGVPGYELLGGMMRHKARVYGHVKGRSRETLIEEAVRLKRLGFTAIGHLNPLLDEDETSPYFKTHAQKIEDAAETVRQLRQAVGPEVDLCIEIHRRLTPPEAVALARAIEQYKPMFYEDPLRPNDPDAMAWVADHIHIPVATGERFISLY